MYKLGCLYSLPDFRNYKYAKIKPIPLSEQLPDSVDLRPVCSPIKDQDGVGSCLAFSLTGIMEFNDKKPDGQFTSLSELFLYYIIRDMMGTTDYDSGGYITYGLKCLAQRGVCTEEEYPYDNAIYRYKEMPTGRLLLSGLKHKIDTYWELDTQNDMLTCLADGYAFICGVSVYDSFVSDEIRRTGVIPMPGPNEKLRGGHAIMICGYDTNTQRFIFRNSWGTIWGMDGYGTISFEYVSSMGWNFWTVRK